MPKINIKDGNLVSDVYVQVTRDHVCSCGQKFTVPMKMPEGVTYTARINVTDVKCPTCGEPMVIPEGHHYIENFKLLTK